jgi:hypothetical protein
VGYRRKVYILRWDESTSFEGLEVRLKGLSVDELTQLAQLADLDANDPRAMDALAPVWAILARGLVSWNLETEDGDPVPVAEFRNEDVFLLLSILKEWSTVVAGVAAPLGRPSSAGSPFPEESIPMEAL